MKHLTFLLVLSFLCCNVFGSYIADLNPPEWRGQEGTTAQVWSFSTDDPAPVADEYINPYGTPCVYEEINGEWNFISYIPDSWLAESIEFYVPIDGSADATCYTIQTIWDPSATSPIELCFYIKDSEENTYQAVMTDEYYASGGLYTSFELTIPNTGDYSILYYEAYESVTGINTATFFKEIVIDTISVPEPMSLSLFALGGLLIRRKLS